MTLKHFTVILNDFFNKLNMLFHFVDGFKVQLLFLISQPKSRGMVLLYEDEKNSFTIRRKQLQVQDLNDVLCS